MNLLKPAAAQIGSNSILTAGERQRALERISIRNSILNLRSFPNIRAREEEGDLSLHAPGSISRPASCGS